MTPGLFQLVCGTLCYRLRAEVAEAVVHMHTVVAVVAVVPEHRS
jgi:hypothetical protein